MIAFNSAKDLYRMPFSIFIPSPARHRRQLRHGVRIGAGYIHRMQFKAGRVSDFHQVGYCQRKRRDAPPLARAKDRSREHGRHSGF